jgi:hypothetical protein
MFKSNTIKLLLYSILILSIPACSSDEEKKIIPDVSHIKIDVPVVRFEQALMALDTLNTEGGIKILETTHPAITKLFLGPIMEDDPKLSFRPQLKAFVSDAEVRRVHDTIQMLFKNFDKWEKEIKRGFQFYKYYFPNRPIPQVYTFFSMYRYGITPPVDSTIGIGLDFFLGDNHHAYGFIENLQYKYIRRTLTPEHLTKSLFERMILEETGAPRGSRLLDQMIHNGKQLYMLDCILPETPDSIKLGYTAQQTQWVKDNEQQMWAHFLKENLLYSTELEKIGKLVNPSPNSPGMPPEAPGRTANYVGLQVVKQLMKRHPNISFEELIKMQDAQKILEMSKYKPAR